MSASAVKRLLLAGFALALMWGAPAGAQQPVYPCIFTPGVFPAGATCPPVNATNPLPTTVVAPVGTAVQILDSAGTNKAAVSAAGAVSVVSTATVAQGSTTAGQVGTLVQGAVSTSAPSYTNAQTSPLSLTTAGKLRVQSDLGFLLGNALDPGNGASSTGTLRVSIANDSSGQIKPITGTAGGGTPVKYLSAASTNSTSVKGSAGQVYSIVIINTTATIYYFKLYDKATAPTCNSDTVLQTYPVPASTTGAGIVHPIALGMAFSSGIGFCLTGALADNDNTNAATGVAINFVYK